MRQLVIGDQHGSLKAVLQVLERCNFDYENDTLINIGDIVDGWSQSSELVQFWIEFSNKCKQQQYFITGNHDWWFREYLLLGYYNQAWLSQGGQSTYDSYQNNKTIDIKEHLKFFENQLEYYIDDENRLFVHGGFESSHGVEDEDPKDVLWWDRSLWQECINYRKITLGLVSKAYSFMYIFPKRASLYKEIFIGHTTCSRIDDMKPVTIGNVTNVDTGGGWEGKLTIMDINTKEYWQSDIVKTLHPEEKGR